MEKLRLTYAVFQLTLTHIGTYNIVVIISKIYLLAKAVNPKSILTGVCPRPNSISNSLLLLPFAKTAQLQTF